MKYIQNRTNWCWVAACKVAGEQYKKNFVDAWQSAIARNADFLHGGLEGNFPGNDQMKMRGLKYVVLGFLSSIRHWAWMSDRKCNSVSGGHLSFICGSGLEEKWGIGDL